MGRASAVASLICMIFPGSMQAEEIRCRVKKVDAARNLLVVTVKKNGPQQEYVVPGTAKILDARRFEIKERLACKGFRTNGTVLITALANKDGKAEVQSIRLPDYYPQPDEFYLDPQQAGRDFLIQGEYAGTIAGQGKWGAQVVVRDDGQFQVQFLQGGLPGAGWDGKNRVQASAATLEGKTTITGSWTGDIAAGKMRGKTADGQAFVFDRVVRQSPTLGAKPPPGAIVLFNGTDADSFPKAQMTADKLLAVPAISKRLLQDCQLHVEFVIPYRGPSRGNSGVFLQGWYEIQLLDSFGRGPSQSGCGGLYIVRKPDVNMTFPPLSWQTFDVDFTAARFDAEDKMTRNPVVTVRHNGVVIHDKVTLPAKGNGGRPTPDGGPLRLQNHGSPVRFRNIWVVEKSSKTSRAAEN